MKSEIDALSTQHRVIAIVQGRHAMMKETGCGAPDHHIAVLQRYAALLVVSGVAAE